MTDLKNEIQTLKVYAEFEKNQNLENNLQFNYWVGYNKALTEIEEYLKDE